MAKNNSNTHPYASKYTLKSLNCDGSIAKRTFEPSRGGRGTRLKTASNKFAKTIIERKSENWPGSINLTMVPNTTAISILEAGPANATMAEPYRILRKLKGFTGTGLAYAKRNLPFDMKNNNAGNIKVPTGSMWAIGLIVSRPESRAVGSPRRSAIQPCAYS